MPSVYVVGKVAGSRLNEPLAACPMGPPLKLAVTTPVKLKVIGTAMAGKAKKAARTRDAVAADVERIFIWTLPLPCTQTWRVRITQFLAGGFWP